MSETEQIFFVYGTLKRGFNNHHLIEGLHCIGEGVTIEKRFRMVQLQTRVARGNFFCPGVQIETDGLQIRGELYSVMEEKTKQALDRLEDEGIRYKKQPVPVRLDNGEEVEAWIYVHTDTNEPLIEPAVQVNEKGGVYSWVHPSQ